MCTSVQGRSLAESAAFAGIGVEPGAEQWFAVNTYARHEKAVAQEARESGVITFLPLVRQVRQWSDRRKVVELPLFSCYVFVRIVPGHDERLRVLRVAGVLQFVGTRGIGIPIPDEQIDAVRVLAEEQLPLCSHPFLKIGQRVRVRSGALAGVEGILVSRCGERTLVVSLDAIQRSLSVRIEGYDVEPVS
jgi:transcription antitermination factor NusG